MDLANRRRGRAEQTFRILAGSVRTIGRSTGADFIVDAPLVSRVHCRVTALANGELEAWTSRARTAHSCRRARRLQAPVIGPSPGVGRMELVALRDAD